MVSMSSYKVQVENADALANGGDIAGAIQSLKDAILQEPYVYELWIALGRMLYRDKQFQEAAKAVRNAEQFDPLQTEFQSIQYALQRGDQTAVKRFTDQMFARIPGHPRATFAIAHLAEASGQFEECIRLLNAALEVSPANIVLRMMLIRCLERSGDFDGTLKAAQHLAEFNESIDTLRPLIDVSLKLGQNEEILEACDRAGKLPGYTEYRQAEMDLIRGQVLRVVGRREESIAAFRRAIEAYPDYGGAWWGLSDFKDYEFTEADLIAIQCIVDNPKIRGSEKCMAAFALAKASERQGDADQTMALYKRANSLYPNRSFDARQFDVAVSELTQKFGADALENQAHGSPEGPTPIFILGLPRSGSTMMEQILASHSLIEGTIEQPVLPSIKRKAHLKCLQRSNTDYLSSVGQLSSDDLAELGQAYIDDGGLFRREKAPFFTDKLPFNFEHIGLINKILPNAKVIDIRRNPLDCGFSLYKQYFAQGVTFSYDLGNIGAYYNGYLKIMDHWQTVLPGRVLPIQYEDLVHDPEKYIRIVLDFVGVPFEPRCLAFHQTKRNVRTASSEQVRQPINTKGIGAWRKVERHLEPLKTALGADTLARFDGLYDA